MINQTLAEETFDIERATKEFTSEHVQLGDYLIESAAWDALTLAHQVKIIDRAEDVTLHHLYKLDSALKSKGKPIKALRKVARKIKQLEKQLIAEYSIGQ